MLHLFNALEQQTRVSPDDAPIVTTSAWQALHLALALPRIHVCDLLYPEAALNFFVMTVQSPTPFSQPSPLPEQVCFERRELGVILSLYGRMVAAGEWRDYGIATLREVAVFAIFRRTAEVPIYRIEKRPKLHGKQGQYAVVGADGQVLRRGHDLAAALRVLEKPLIRSID